MILEALHCPSCDHTDVIKHGRTAAGKQPFGKAQGPRYRCQNPECEKTFIRDYSYNAYLPNLKEQISDMAMNGSGIRDTARVLNISPNTVIETLKKSPRSPIGQEAVLRALEPTQTIRPVRKFIRLS